ncbi:MAG: hypothetical protein KDK36_11045, partial [Leptospiraceae bacterium]|nr:hypothetical protein [Leptospiraceae bacterium]
MSRYDLGASDDYIYYPGTSIPINHLNIKDDGKLRSLEADLLADSYIRFYNQLRDSTIFDEDYLKLLHKKTFESLYTFAG